MTNARRSQGPYTRDEKSAGVSSRCEGGRDREQGTTILTFMAWLIDAVDNLYNLSVSPAGYSGNQKKKQICGLNFGGGWLAGVKRAASMI